ncbi:hypothetical protein DCAR_0625140 [Daucus carota subsp. sativus]|uniref:DUF4371 domain-containing protein n=1 Tax=Daucus carota subsp. sativus TaxID=79200 RepID=A0AAF1B4C2_DAUCS|nr:hypothetical protein DCAR_0625140 [Daucus carota subsp. sativus]
MIELLAEFDTIIRKIQNEMIQLLAQEVKSILIGRVKDAKYYSVILYCTPDASSDEQMSLVLRCVNVSESPIRTREFFTEFLQDYDASGIGFDNSRGQGYDNRSNMKGNNKSVQTSLLERNPRAFYTPCACHSLNLILSDI